MDSLRKQKSIKVPRKGKMDCWSSPASTHEHTSTKIGVIMGRIRMALRPILHEAVKDEASPKQRRSCYNPRRQLTGPGLPLEKSWRSWFSPRQLDSSKPTKNRISARTYKIMVNLRTINMMTKRSHDTKIFMRFQIASKFWREIFDVKGGTV